VIVGVRAVVVVVVRVGMVVLVRGFVAVGMVVLVRTLVLAIAAPGAGGLSRPIDVEAAADVRATLTAAETDAKPPDPHRLDGLRDHARRHAEIDQRGDGHVAGDAGGGLEMEMKPGEGRPLAGPPPA
jgi:hypothetical protein